MPQISTQEFEQLPLRVHDFLVGVPLHDVWAVDLPRTRPGITLDEFVRAAGALPLKPSPVVRALLNIRLFVGRLLGWDREPDAPVRENFATRLTTADLSKSTGAGGHARGTLPGRLPLRKRAASRADQPDGPRRRAERPRRDGKWLPLLFRRVRAQRQPLDADVHGPHRPVPQVDRLSVAPAQRSGNLEPNLRSNMTSPGRSDGRLQRRLCRAPLANASQPRQKQSDPKETGMGALGEKVAIVTGGARQGGRGSWVGQSAR
jgi:Protein of unknown function (DUF2867)